MVLQANETTNISICCLISVYVCACLCALYNLIRLVEHRSSRDLGKTFSKKNSTSIFLFVHKNIGCGYSLEVPQRGASNAYPQYMFW